ncbi:hypothetical protein CGMCC3_g3496 [Colletotrichum fructicola]|nr:uncharacterized protein CGMCC3_g3496 [Colletotrichum fructicola]KAE9580483.1 hypothetical protein CGMCC3_g3496 [Colletotrichum fructicola]
MARAHGNPTRPNGTLPVAGTLSGWPKHATILAFDNIQRTQFSVSSPSVNLLNLSDFEMADAKSTSPAPREKLEAQVKSADMTEDMQQECIEVAQEAMAKFTIEKDIAQHIKRTFDERKGPTWHCIVGRNFGSFVTHETKHFIYFYLGHCAILLFKTQ